ncbi:MAG: hypothetical protein N2053_00230 [Chitinispirillaceae bacterium]|nr:hypothetical protein [Chitinispirillaceae bacterium]
MGWFLRHKIITLLIIFGVVYWYYNPSDRFGFYRKGIVVFKRIPVAFLDIYIDPDNNLYLEGNLSEKKNVIYWFENHFTSYKNNSTGLIPLIIGTGFEDTGKVAFDKDLSEKCKELKFIPHFYNSKEAIERYNTSRLEGKKAALLLKIN